MKKTLRLLFLVLAVAFGLNASADETTINLSSGYNQNEVVMKAVSPDKGVKLTLPWGTAWYTKGKSIRIYGGTFTFEAKGSISKIVFTWQGTHKPGDANICDVGTYTDSTDTWTGDDEVVSFTFNQNGSSRWAIKSVKITYEPNGEKFADVDVDFTQPLKPSVAVALSNGYDMPRTAVQVTGTVRQIQEISTKYGNATFYIADDSTSDVTVRAYRCKYIDNEKFTSEDQLHVGDIVTVEGKVWCRKEGSSSQQVQMDKGHIVKVTTAGIHDITATATHANDAIYNLAGQRVDRNYKGIIIVGGKKILNR